MYVNSGRMVASPSTKGRRMLVLELSEATKHFLDKYIVEGKLPTFEKLLQGGKFLKTKVASYDFIQGRETPLTPWTVWPSIYTGMSPKEHGIIGFGQDPHVLEGRCIWDRLNQKGITTGVFGSLINAPVYKDPQCLFYLPHALTKTPICFPGALKAIQRFFLFFNQNNEDPIETVLKCGCQVLYRALKDLPFKIAREVISQVFFKSIKNVAYKRNSLLSQARLRISVFDFLYKKFQPDFATLHLDHIAHAQHLYWRAAEPECFKDALGELDSYFFASLEARKSYDTFFKDIILDSFILMDTFLSGILGCLDKNTLLVIITGLGQKRCDPVDEIHRPEVYFYNIEKLFSLLNITNCEILSQMNPEITLKFQSSLEASLNAFKLSDVKILGEYPLFSVEQIENQLFLKETLPANIWFLGNETWVENKSNEYVFPLFEYVKLSQLKDQHTSQNSQEGWMLFYGNLNALPAKLETLDIIEIFPLLLGYFDDNLLF